MFSAFVDLVGTRERARSSARAYLDSLVQFQERLAESAGQLPKSALVRVYVFSDSAFLESATWTDLVRFLKVLRGFLLEDGLYFKGAIGSGGLAARPAAQALGTLTSSKVAALIENRIFGNCFSEVAAHLFVAQELIKGIGFSINEQLASGEVQRQKDCVWSCFLPEFGSRRAKAFLDLRLRTEDLTVDNAERLLRDAFAAKSQSRKFGRFYVSLLVTWVQSAGLGQSSRKQPDRILDAAVSGELDRLLGDVVGIELVYLAILARVLRERDEVDIALRREVNRKLMRHRRVASALEFAPVEILPEELRSSFILDLSKVMQRMDFDEQAAQSLAAQLYERGLRMSEIARKLRREGFLKARGEGWLESDVAAWLAPGK